MSNFWPNQFNQEKGEICNSIPQCVGNIDLNRENERIPRGFPRGEHNLEMFFRGILQEVISKRCRSKIKVDPSFNPQAPRRRCPWDAYECVSRN